MNDAPKPMNVSLLDWRPFRKNSLLGFAKIRLGALKMSDITVHANHGRRWVGLPARPILGTDGKVQTDERGKVKYAPILEWDNRDTGDRFSEAVIAAIAREHPHDVDA